MKRLLLALSALAIALSALAEDTKPAPKKVPASPAKPSPAEQRIRDVSTAKAAFMAALGSCPRPEDCDPDSPRRNPELTAMLKDAEEAFMEACAQCASDKACEEERAKIRDGHGRFGYNVCAVNAPKGTDKKAPEKKPAPATKPTATPAAAPK
jgi:hypothetical protein